MRMGILVVAASCVLCLVQGALATDHGFIFGTITTKSGDHYAGRIRWDHNEGFWDDLIDATKTDDDRYESNHRHGARISILGIKIDSGDWGDENSSSELCFGHIESIEPRSSGRVIVRLKNGEKVRFEDSGTDIGSSNRGIEVDAGEEEVVDLDWGDVERIEFKPEPDDYHPTKGGVERLYGRVKTEAGDDIVGFVAWDMDEIYSTDILDGEVNDRDRKIPFGTIASIEKTSRDACLVRRQSGPEFRVSGTNDVDSGNRGVAVSVPGLGRVRIDWDEFESVTFMPIPPGLQRTYGQFDGGKRLHGTVTDSDGKTWSGAISWDNDERFGWECLNGEQNSINYDVELANIAMIERHSGRAARVTLRNGTTLRLRGSNDVDDDNKGVFIETTKDDTEEVNWDEFEKITFE
jgi:hypothetical protein